MTPGNDRTVLTVGAVKPHGVRNPEQITLYPFSGYGQTIEGDTVPDLVAPGVGIVGIIDSTSESYQLVKTESECLQMNPQQFKERLLKDDDFFEKMKWSGSGPSGLPLERKSLHTVDLKKILLDLQSNIIQGECLVINEHYLQVSGASFATACVSGGLALLYQWMQNQKIELPPDDVKKALKASCTPLPKISRAAQGAGLLDLKGASDAITRMVTFGKSG